MHPTLAAILLAASCIANGNEIPTSQPGTKVILAIPFQPQKRSGVCAAAAAINVLKCLDPDLKIDQEELFALFDAGRAGASPQQVIRGIEKLGYSGNLRNVVQNDPELIRAIQSNLDAGYPMVAGTDNHALVLYGYNNTEKKGVFYLWDQRQPNKRAPNGLPAGTLEITQEKFMKKMIGVLFITPKPKQP